MSSDADKEAELKAMKFITSSYVGGKQIIKSGLLEGSNLINAAEILRRSFEDNTMNFKAEKSNDVNIDFEVKKIHSYKIIECTLFYEVEWVGFQDTTFESASNLVGAPSIVARFWEEHALR
jgi:hypothetical protein